VAARPCQDLLSPALGFGSLRFEPSRKRSTLRPQGDRKSLAVALQTRCELRLEAGPASTRRPGASGRTFETHLLGPDPGQPGEAHQDDDYEKLHTVIFFRAWLRISWLRCSAGHQRFPAVPAQQVQELPARPLLRIRTDCRGLNALRR